MTTAGNLVFQGKASGEFFAYDARNGKALWSVDLGSGISAPPITYAVDGKQYISLLVGWGGAGLLAGSLAAHHGWAYKVHPRRMYTFSLDGKAAIPPSPPPTLAKPLDRAELTIDEDLAEKGKHKYVEHCVACHGGGGVSGGAAPDLRASPVTLTRASFAELLRVGRRPMGMPSFPEFENAQIEQLFQYIRRQARRSLEEQASEAGS